MSARTQKLQKLQDVFNKYIRLRDRGKPCIYCGGAVIGFGNFGHSPSAAHYMPVSTSEAIRFDTDNVHLAGYTCNQKDDREVYRKNLIERIGKDRVEALERSGRYLAKFTISDLDEKIKYFRKLTEKMEMAD